LTNNVVASVPAANLYCPSSTLDFVSAIQAGEVFMQLRKCNSANPPAGITCKSDYSVLKFFRDKVVTTGIFHNELVVTNNAYALVPNAQITNQFTIADDTKTAHQVAVVSMNDISNAGTP